MSPRLVWMVAFAVAMAVIGAILPRRVNARRGWKGSSALGEIRS